MRASGVQVEDAQWHMVNVHRSGLIVSLTVDNNSTFQLTLNGTALTLDVGTSQIFAGGRPTIGGRVSGGFTGCLQDIRVDQFTLPTSGSNGFAAVTFRGSGGVVQGCVLGPCFPNPCGTGNCSELDRTSFACNCLDGTVLRGRSCPEPPPPLTGILPIAVSAGGGVLVLAVLATASKAPWPPLPFLPASFLPSRLSPSTSLLLPFPKARSDNNGSLRIM